MQYHCSRCHYVLTAPAGTDGDGGELQCPRCKAEAGLEAQHAPPLPMKLFAVFLGLSLVAVVASLVMSVAPGSGAG
ncbi:hypothetical protein OV079_19855 [Nannocystis pusilla]|jgi:hypothetical protein|uniref:Uncharacterized protein n=1 Tax=Nannocystis pusilla TaxID=889268 RepID=A0A9X3IXS1_9BACT|nr:MULTISPECIES: hypothetical protein [Nannocystis]MCY0995450.1 hypothetical protein [Nannocystis sp. ILAH1]MCY1007766.1 hypothetical protein [Nannocystis pusilla]MCY1069858.1 hypothetical protein [Nannocystis sp. RBIL2]